MVALKIATVLAALASTALSVDITVAAKGGNKTSDTPYGLLHEDINYSGDGGIYAEMIRNRAFQGSEEFPRSLAGWTPVGGANLALMNLSTPLSKELPASMNVQVPSKQKKREDVGFTNSGWWGFDVRRQEYKGSFYVRGQYDGSFTASFQSAITNETFATTKVKSKTKKDKWIQHEFTLKPRRDAPSSNNTFSITFDPKGVKGDSLDFNLISLFPPTYKGRKNGLRIDLAEAFEAINPKFLRFPGGNALEGPDLAHPWMWDETLGPLENRPGRPGVWGYQTSDGLGLLEYLHWCDDMDMIPVLGVWAGLAIDGAFVAKEDLQPWIQYALDEIEFIRGPVTSKWGKLRAQLGHPKPWDLKYVEIGNEDWLAGRPAGFQSYIDYRFPMFKEAIQKAYPDITIIASPSIYDNFTFPPDVVGDWHPYKQPDDFYNDFHRMDKLTKDQRHIVGEYASVHPNGGSDWEGDLVAFPWWQGAVGEAIFAIATERNGDRILGSLYAPILRNMNSWSWSACLIQFEADTSRTSLSTSYYVMKLISRAHVTHNLPTTPAEGNTTSLFWVAGRNEDEGDQRVMKFANYNTTNHADTPVSVKFEGQKDTRATLTLLSGTEGPLGFNDPAKQNNVVKEEKKVLRANKDGKFEFKMPELSVAVLTLGEERRGGRGKRETVGEAQKAVERDAYSVDEGYSSG